jgi:CheY-like chemotaxis protein
MFVGDAERKGISYEVIESPGFPRMVLGDPRRVRQAVSNVVANAIKNTSSGAVKVEMWVSNTEDDCVEVEIVIQDTGKGMSSKSLDALFRELEQVGTEADGMDDEDPEAENSSHPEGEGGAGSADRRTLGLGLAVVARIVRTMNGQLRLKSEEGQGSRFVIQLPFERLPEGGPTRPSSKDSAVAALRPESVNPVSTNEGEVMLVDNAGAVKHAAGSTHSSLGRMRSITSMKTQNSEHSARSMDSRRSSKSDVDRLIDAITEPHLGPKSPQPHAQSAHSFRDKPGSVNLGRPTLLSRTASAAEGVTGEASLPRKDIPGQEAVVGSKTPLKAVKVPDEGGDFGSPSRMGGLYDASRRLQLRDRGPAEGCFRILVAEDDPVNSKIIKKRLEKAGHDVYLTINGEECASRYAHQRHAFDVVLMDMQVGAALVREGLTKVVRQTVILLLFALTLRGPSGGHCVELQGGRQT